MIFKVKEFISKIYQNNSKNKTMNIFNNYNNKIILKMKMKF